MKERPICLINITNLKTTTIIISERILPSIKRNRGDCELFAKLLVSMRIFLSLSLVGLNLDFQARPIRFQNFE